MQQNEYLSELFCHMQWADSVVWNYILSNEKAVNDERLGKLLYHLHVVQRAFFSLWAKEKLEFPEPGSFKDLASVCKWGQEYHKALNSFLKDFDDTQTCNQLDVPWSKWLEQKIDKPVEPVTIGQTMLQVTSHSTYHRGQINSRFRELGGEPPIVDFIAWVWMGKPAAKWPE